MSVWRGDGGGGGGNVFVVERTADPTPADDGFPNGAIWINTVTDKTFILLDNSPGNAKWQQATGAAWIEDEFVPTVGQITFITSKAPTDASSLTFEVNGVTMDDDVDFSISGTTVTWLNTLYSMETTDRVAIRYR